MDRRKIVVIALLMAVIVVAAVSTAIRISSELTAPALYADRKIEKIDMDSLEVYAETSDDWANKYAPDAIGRYKNPKTGKYTIVDIDGQFLPAPQFPDEPLLNPEAGKQPGEGGKQATAAAREEASLSASTVGAAEPAPAAKYNLLLISIDTCRADHLKCYGYSPDTSPHLDQLAKEGVLFENLTSASSWTVPSHMSMFTSLYPSVHGVETFKVRLGEGVPTLAQRLAESGYVTAAFVTGPMLNRRYGFNRGFQLYDDFSANPTFGQRGGISNVATNPVITDLGTQWLKKHSQESFFLFLHYWDCHYDYIPPAPYDRKFDPDYKGKEHGRYIYFREDELTAHISAVDLAHLAALYDGEIAYTDEHVGKFLQLLQDLGLSDKTLVIVLADHGEAFLEHGKLTHGNSLYEEALHVPLIMRLPGVIPAGKRVVGNVSHVDLMPTALGLLHLAGPEQIQGTDLSPVILSDKPVPERLIYSELAFNGYNLTAVRWGNRKLLGTTGTLAGAQLEEVAGSREKVIAGADLKRDCPEAALQALTMGPPSIRDAKAAEANEPDANLIRQLKSLGYVQ
jgi:arylsulfatase A-like enzyme